MKEEDRLMSYAKELNRLISVQDKFLESVTISDDSLGDERERIFITKRVYVEARDKLYEFFPELRRLMNLY